MKAAGAVTTWGGEEWSRAELARLLDPRLAKWSVFGLRPVADPVPHDVLEDAMRGFLGKIAAKRRPRPGWSYRCAEQLVLEQGQAVHANLGRMRTRPMMPGACFDNAYVTAARTGGRYCEGYGIMDGSAEPFHHAWVAMPDGSVEDPTWPLVWRGKLVDQPHRCWSGDVVYLGFAIDKEPHGRWLDARLYPNLLSFRDDDIDETMRLGTAAWA